MASFIIYQRLKKILLLAIFTTLPSISLQAQDEVGVFAIQVGYLHSHNSIKLLNNSLFGKPEIYSKPGFYSGVRYTKVVQGKITSRIGINYQNKGLIMEKLQNNGFSTKVRYNYNYIGIEPAIGFNIFKNTNLFLGPSINYLLNKNKIVEEQNGRVTEFGLIAQASYKIHRLELDLAYFKGINNYSEMPMKDPFFKFSNQNWRLGIGYIF